MTSFEQFALGIAQRLEQGTAQLQAQATSLCATIDNWVMVTTAKLDGRTLDDIGMRCALASESILPRWKRKPNAFHLLATGEVVQFGSAHSMRGDEVKTTYIRSDFTMADVDYLQRVVMASRVIMADEANTILRRIKPNNAYSKRAPAVADADPCMPEWRNRPERHLSPRDLVMESGLKGRALAKELARIR
jgi:hypothetical protein